jgi:2-dehydropantoate 2-reductase
VGRHCVIGLGPVGALVAGRLAGAGHDVVAVDSLAERARAVRDGGLRLEGDGLAVPGPVALAAVRDQVPGAVADGPFDSVLVCTKANDLPHLVGDLGALLAPQTTLASLQNGWGLEDWLLPVAGPGRLVRVVVNFAGLLERPGHVRQTFFHPPNWAGGFDPAAAPRARSVADLLTGIGLRTDVADDIRLPVWRKVVHLAILAPLCAITRMDMRTALAHKEVRRLAQGLLDECIAVGDRLGFDCGNGFFETSMDYVLEAGDHPPSMLVDVLRGRPTEVSFINGKIVEAGARLGVDVPLNRAVAALVSAMEPRPVPPPRR